MSLDNGLWKAAEVLNEKGFAKNAIEDGSGQVCALGAYHRVYNPKSTVGDTGAVVRWARQEHDDEFSALSAVIRELYPERVQELSTDSNAVVNVFNDHSLTTAEDVKKVFRIAAIRLATA